MWSRHDAEAEAVVLKTEAGRSLLVEVNRVTSPGPSDLARWRRDWPAETVAAAVRLTETRRKGGVKFVRADRMWLEPTALEQATAEPVARHKATRFGAAGSGELVVDLCCGLGGDALALATFGPVLAVDLDQGMTRRARWNAEVYDVAGRLLVVRGRAEELRLPDGSRVHVDPDRRAGRGPRATSVQDYAPGLSFLQCLTRRARGGAIKLGPASDFATHFGSRGFEIELVSLNGECKEATVWFGDLASCRRRATALPSGATWTDLDAPMEAGAAVGEIEARVFDPDPALVRAGLLDGFAEAHGLSKVAPGQGLLTGPGPLGSPLVAEFLVREVLPLDRKRLRRLVAESGLGPLEIKVRGLDIRPETLRRELRPSGDRPATLLLVGGTKDRPGIAILADRVCRGA